MPTFVIAAFVAGAAVAPSRAPTSPVSGRLIVRLKADGAPPTGLNARYGARFEPLFRGSDNPASAATLAWQSRRGRAPRDGEAAARRLEGRFPRTFVVELGKSVDASSALAAYRRDANVEHAELDLPLSAQWEPNDPYFRSYGSWGQPHADLYGVHITASPRAWDASRGDHVVVAVVDTGLDWEHDDIDDNVWTNPGEIAGNGIDDEGNGFVDDVRGWDFVHWDNAPWDGHGHGTHVSGTVAAEGNNGIGIVGIAPRARIMPLKGLSDGGGGWASDLASAIYYAARNGADVVNCSWGGPGSSAVVEDAVRYAHSRGALVVVAAGNSNFDVLGYTPASVTEAVTVAASDPQDRKADFSNWGLGVDVTAPGTGILSLRARNTDMYRDGQHIVGLDYYWANGTSMAAPHVAGAAALLIALEPAMPNETIRDKIAFRADEIRESNAGDEGRLGGGRLNAWRAVTEPLPHPVHSISGTVIDRSGRPIAGCRVELGEMGSRRVTTGADGRYSFTPLRPGRYTVKASRLGFEFRPVFRPYRPLLATATDQNFVGVERWSIAAPDPAAQTGWSANSVALDANGFPHISYWFDAQADLRYAAWDGASWRVQTVDAAEWNGINSGVAVDSLGRPHIAYSWWDGVTPQTGALKYARWNGSAWEIEVLDQLWLSGDIRLALDAADRPHVIYRDQALKRLMHAYRDGNGWSLEVVDADGDVGWANALALDSLGRPHVAYNDHCCDGNTVDGLKYAVREETGWSISVVDDDIGGGDRCGLALGPDGRPHVVYSGVLPSVIRYATRNGTTWLRETLLTNTPSFGNSIAVDGYGSPHVFIHEYDRGFAYRTKVVGEWGTYWKASLVEAGDVGYFNNVVMGPRGTLHLVYESYGRAQLTYARSVELGDSPAPPSVWITEPTSGAVVSNTVTISAHVSAGPGIDHVEVLVDGVLRGVDSVVPYAYDWDTTDVPNGGHVVTVRAVDASGRSAEQSVKVQVANFGPRLGARQVGAGALAAATETRRLSAAVRPRGSPSPSPAILRSRRAAAPPS